VGTSPAFNQKDLSFILQLKSFHNAATEIFRYFHLLVRAFGVVAPMTRSGAAATASMIPLCCARRSNSGRYRITWA